MTASAIESDSLGMVSSRGGMCSVLELVSVELGREGRREAVRSHPLESLGHLALDLDDLAGVDPLRLELGAEDDDRIALPPPVELPFGPIRARIASRVPDEAVRQRLD